MTDKSSIQQILGILAQRPQLLSEVDKYSLTITDFSNRFEKYIFLAISGLYKQGATSIEPIDVANFLEQEPSGKKFFDSNNAIEYLQDAIDFSKPDNFDYYYNKLKKINLLRYLKKQGIDMEKEPDKANKIFQDNNLPVMYNNKGEVNVTKYHKFVMLNGVALNRAFSENVALEEWLTEMDDMNEKLNNLVTIGKAHGEQIDFDHKSWADSWMPFWNSHDSMYRGTIFIPTEYNIFTSAVGRGESLTTEEAERLHAIQQNEDAAKSIVSTGLL